MPNPIKIKRRSAAGAAGAPTSLLSGELALNENTNVLYYGRGDNGSGVATSIIEVGGSGATGTWGISITGNAATATAWQTGRTVTLTGGVTGASAAWTGAGNLSIETTVSNTSHKYHEFVAGSYFYDSYEQGRFFRLFTENYAYDTIRYCAIQDVEFYNYINSAWEAWSGGNTQVKKLIDGRQETYTDLDHDHRTIRFTVTKNTGWPTTCLLAMYQSWYGTAWADVTITIEDATSTAGPWTVKRTVTWGAANTAANYGWHAYVTNDLHNGRTITRITIDCNDWTDNGGYIYKRINQVCLFSNYSGGTLAPWSWNYDKVVAFSATPTAPTAAVGTNSTALATTAFVNAEIANDAPTKTGGGASGSWGISITGSSASCTGNAATATSAATLTTSRTINGTSFNGSANITTANWGTSRTLTIGSTGKSVNGSGDVTWTLAEIGALGATAKAADSEKVDGVDSTNIVYGVNGAAVTGLSATQDVYELGQYKAGFWQVTGASWTPNTNWWWGATFAHASNGPAYNFSGQLAFANGGGGDNLWARTINNGTPSAWSRLVSSGNFNAYAPTLTGTGASGTWGISITGNAATATALSSARTFQLTGDVTGNVSSDLTSGASITAAIASGVIVDADVNASAAIAGTKISPNFGSQNVTTTGSSTAAQFVPTSSTVPTNGLYLPAANTVGIATNSTSRLQINSGGQFLFNTTSLRGVSTATTPQIQFESSTINATFVRNSGDNIGAIIVLGHSRTIGGAIGVTSVNSGDQLGAIRFAGADGTTIEPYAAQIQVQVDGTPGTNDMPGRLVFSTTADGASSPTERMRIDSAGNVKIGGSADRATTAGTNQLVIFNGTAPVGTLSNGISFYSTAGECRVMDSSGNATLLSPHDSETNEWIYDSTHTPTGRRLRVDMEKLVKFLDAHFGLGFVQETFVTP